MEVRFDKTVKLADNAMLRTKPELFSEWNFEKNDKLGLNIYKITHGSDKVAWWDCPVCMSPFDMKVDSRARRDSKCPYCRGLRVNSTNSLASLRPDIASQWHPILNGELVADDVTYSSNKKVWWLGSDCGHPWEASINNRTGRGETGCSVCSNRKILIGFNDMWTANPELASQLANPEEGYKYFQSSNIKVDWKCLECENIIPNKMIYCVNQKGLSCPRCSDGISFGEKFVYNLLKESSIDFEFDIMQDWSEGRRYDFSFELKGKKYIIEVHGLQHYKEGFSTVNGDTLAEVKENDKFKECLAKENGIDSYIIIDARESAIEWIKCSILSSELIDILNADTDFNEVAILATKTFIKDACNLWNSRIRDINEIAKILKVHRATAVKYLKRGAEIGWCDYCPVESVCIANALSGIRRRKSVVQLDKNCFVMKHWESTTEIGSCLKINYGSISNACTGRGHTAGGFKWMYKEDYNKMIQEELSHQEYMIKYYPKKIRRIYNIK